jgi:hypothetical protein
MVCSWSGVANGCACGCSAERQTNGAGCFTPDLADQFNARLVALLTQKREKLSARPRGGRDSNPVHTSGPRLERSERSRFSEPRVCGVFPSRSQDRMRMRIQRCRQRKYRQISWGISSCEARSARRDCPSSAEGSRVQPCRIMPPPAEKQAGIDEMFAPFTPKPFRPFPRLDR